MDSSDEDLPLISLSKRKGRGNKKPLLVGFTSRLIGRQELLSSATSKATQRNVDRAAKLLKAFASLHDAPDPRLVTKNSSMLILNLLAQYCKFGTAQSLKDDSMGALIQGLRIVYEQFGHHQNWTVDDVTGIARGNPLNGNKDVSSLRRAHRVHIARYGGVSLKARPITANIICDHAERFWFNGSETGASFDIRDVELHAIMVLGLHLGLRFDEVSKLDVDHVSVTSGNILLTLTVSIKNSTVQRNYVLEEWAGNSELRYSLFMDPYIALLSWLLIRGAYSGPVFCDTTETKCGSKLIFGKPLSSNKFTSFLRCRLKLIGIGNGDAIMYTGHSIKRGSVQLYRSLGYRDEQIMEKIQMSGSQAYANYCAAYNDCKPLQLPRFTSVADYIRHAENIVEEKEMIFEGSEFEDFLDEITST